MRRNHWSWSSLAFLSLTGAPLLAQDGDWKPVSEHRARYESPDGTTQQISLIGKPITGRSKIDQAVSPASFGSDQRNALPLPQPPTQPLQYEGMPYPKQVVMGYPQAPGAAQLQPAGKPMGVPMGAPANGVVTYPAAEPINAVPYASGAPVIVNGQVVGTPVVGDPTFAGGYPGMEYSGFTDRYYMQAIHGTPGIWYGSVDFLLYTLNRDQSPPLVITGPQTTTDINSPGVSVLYGGTLPSESLYGGRVTMGVWFNRCQTWGMFGSFFTTGTKKEEWSASSPDGSTFLARPFYNNSPVNFDGSPHTPAEDIERVAQTGLGGSVSVNRTALIRGGDLNFRFNWFNGSSSSGRTMWNIDSYFGVKYMGLDESLTVTENLVGLDNNPVVGVRGARFFVQDSFSTRNNFIGGNLGLMSEARLGRFFLETHSGIALGSNQQEIVINGNTQITPPGGTPSPLMTGGLLAQQTNIGQYQHNQFSIVPEFGLKFGINLTDHMRIYAGYEMMYWTNVVRPGQQIDYTVNTSQLPRLDANNNPVNPPVVGSPRPAFNLQTSNLWISGFSAGLSWVF